ncbi:hypothetical protein ACJIZ3_011319 [Penstemon smallii]|uniref:Transposase, Ptta/En/Spm, plant n=1 Tax=Penstemon smallii TaxID=265156 RepID=A0ABD3UIZ4_9LAMI
MATRSRIHSTASDLDMPAAGQDRNMQVDVQNDSHEQVDDLAQISTTTDTNLIKNNETRIIRIPRIVLQSGASSKKGIRGVTKGASVDKKRRRTNQKLDITIHPDRRRIVGENAKDFKTEACVVLKQHAPIKYSRWMDIPDDDKKKIWISMKQKFNLQEDIQIKNVVFEQLNRQYRSRRYKLHEYYLKIKGDIDILKRPPSGVSEDDWKMLINYFESDAFKDKSDRNKENRKSLKMSHSCGTKSTAQYCYEDRDVETGKEPTRTCAWQMTRYNDKKKSWVDEASRRAYEDIVRYQNEAGEDGQDPLTEDEAFIKALGPEKSSRLCGCGDGLKPPSKRGQSINKELQKENEELKKQAEENKESLESLKKTIDSLVSNQENQVQLQVQAILKNQLPAILQNLGQFGQTLSNNIFGFTCNIDII